jgi:hypothetical protein
VVVAASALVLGIAPTVSAQPGQLVSLNPATLLPPPPPVGLELSIPLREVRYPKRIASRELVDVGLTPGGTPTSVRVGQRLVLSGVGDYTFSVPAPVVAVRPGPGTESEPGARVNEILWQGFVPRRRVLSAVADLRTRDVADALPLRIAATATQGRVALTIRNATPVPVVTFTADVARADAVRALAGIAAAIRAGRPVPDQDVQALGPVAPRTTVASALLAVRGRLQLPREAVRAAAVRGPARLDRQRGVVTFDATLDGTLRIEITGLSGTVRTPRVRITASPLDPPVRPRVGSGRELLAQAIDLSLSYELARRYRTFLQNPDALGPRSGGYTFETSVTPARPPAEREANGGGPGPLALAGIVAGVILVGCAGVVAWAHS